MARVSNGAVEAHAEHIPDGLEPDSINKLYKGEPPLLRGQLRKHATA